MEYPKFLQDFLYYLKAIKGRSEMTVKEYGYDIYNLSRFLYQRRHQISNDDFSISDMQPEFFEKVTLIDLHSYMAYLDIEKHNSARTRARKSASIRTFFRYLIQILNLPVENIAERLETPKSTKRHPVYLTLNESEELLDQVFKNDKIKKNIWMKYRDYCILILFLNCGMRLSELSGIKIEMIKNDILTVLGKGNKERTVYLNEVCMEAIEKYMKVRPDFNTDYLFVSQKGDKLSNRGIQYRIKFYLQEAGFDPKIYSTHKLRHTAATLMYKYGHVDMRALQEILGHSNVSTTQIYTHIDSEHLREAIQKNPLNHKNIDNIENQ